MSNSTYLVARNTTIRSAIELYGGGSTQCQAVQRAWDAVRMPRGNEACAGTPPPSGTARPNAHYNALFNDYGNSAGCSGWSGADGTQSVRLPSGKRAWFFSDTYLNHPAERGGFNVSFLRNSIVVQNGNNLRTITGGNTCREGDQSLPFWDRYAKTPVTDGTDGWFWSGDAKVVGSELVKFYFRNDSSVSPWTETHTAIARIPLSSLESSAVLDVRPTLMTPRASSGRHPIIWGTALLDAGGYTYVYGWGAIDASLNKKLYLARVAPASLANPSQWEYNTGAGNSWSAKGNQPAARPIAGSPLVEAGFSVALVSGSYWLMQHEPNLVAGAVVAHPAPQPWSFTSRRVTLYRPPEVPHDAAHKYQFVYEARFHPQLSGSSTVLTLSYNVNTSAVSVGCRSRNDHDATIYRPRFIDVPSSLFVASAATAAGAPTTASAAPTADASQAGRRLRSAAPQPPVPPEALGSDGSMTAELVRPAAAAVEGDVSWYDQWSAPLQANGGCPKLDRATTLTATVQPDGRVDFDWNDYGLDMWYWFFSRDATRGEAFQQRELWTTSTEAVDYPVQARADNGHTFAWYVLPFATGASAEDRNGDGRPDNQAPISNVLQRSVRVQPPAAPTGVSARKLGPGQVEVSWARVTYPSDKVYYWIYYWNISAGQTQQQAQRVAYPAVYTATGQTLATLAAGSTYGFHVRAENLAGLGPPSSPTTATL